MIIGFLVLELQKTGWLFVLDLGTVSSRSGTRILIESLGVGGKNLIFQRV